MIDLWYLNTKNISGQQVSALLKSLPQEMVNEVMRFRNHEDRRLKLFGKLMIKKYYEDKDLEFSWREWQVAPGGKPYYYNGTKKFNISHAGDYVTSAFSDQEIGADIERATDFDLASISSYFHPKEAEHILSASDPNAAFLKLWTRKESYLKAIGKGIVDGLHHENCLPDKLVSQGTWYLHNLPVIPHYHISLCTPVPDSRIQIRELFPAEFYTHFNCTTT